MIFPPHTKRTLQLLNVVCFNPFAQNYAKELDQRIQKTQRGVSMKKRELYSMFWKTWVASFTVSLVLKSVSTTAMHSPNAHIILGRLTYKNPQKPGDQMMYSSNTGISIWLKSKSLLHSIARDKGNVEGILHTSQR